MDPAYGREVAEALDRDDELAGLRDRFVVDDAGPIYVDGNSLGRLPRSTPAAAVEEGALVVAEAGIHRLRAKSLSMTEMLISFFDAELAPLGIGMATPRDPDRRGSHLVFRHPDAWRICRALVEEMGVVPDFREPRVT